MKKPYVFYTSRLEPTTEVDPETNEPIMEEVVDFVGSTVGQYLEYIHGLSIYGVEVTDPDEYGTIFVHFYDILGNFIEETIQAELIEVESVVDIPEVSYEDSFEEMVVPEPITHYEPLELPTDIRLYEELPPLQPEHPDDIVPFVPDEEDPEVDISGPVVGQVEPTPEGYSPETPGVTYYDGYGDGFNSNEVIPYEDLPDLPPLQPEHPDDITPLPTDPWPITDKNDRRYFPDVPDLLPDIDQNTKGTFNTFKEARSNGTTFNLSNLRSGPYVIENNSFKITEQITSETSTTLSAGKVKVGSGVSYLKVECSVKFGPVFTKKRDNEWKSQTLTTIPEDAFPLFISVYGYDSVTGNTVIVSVLKVITNKEAVVEGTSISVPYSFMIYPDNPDYMLEAPANLEPYASTYPENYGVLKVDRSSDWDALILLQATYREVTITNFKVYVAYEPEVDTP